MNSIAPFDFVLPTKVRFGKEIIKEITEEIEKLDKKNVMIITDKGIVAAGIIDKVLAEIDTDRVGEVVVFDDVEPNPRDTTVHKASDLAKVRNIEILVAVGGGSSIDVAKAVAIIMTGGGVIQDYEGLDAIKTEPAPIIAIPTTVGTGSEVTFWSVITDTERHFKMSVGSTKIAPKVALVDPNLVSTLPASIIAATGMDAMTHAIEGYTCKVAEPITDACALYAIKILSENIRKAVFNDDEEAKASMLVASLIAGIAFGNSDIAAVHAMAEALGGKYDTPHGIANAILLPFVLEYNYVADLEKFKNIAEALGENVAGGSLREGAYKAVDAIMKLNEDLGIPSLREIGAKPEDFEELAYNSSINVSIDSNPRKANKEDLFKLFEKAYGVV